MSTGEAREEEGVSNQTALQRGRGVRETMSGEGDVVSSLVPVFHRTWLLEKISERAISFFMQGDLVTNIVNSFRLPSCIIVGR